MSDQQVIVLTAFIFGVAVGLAIAYAILRRGFKEPHHD